MNLRRYLQILATRQVLRQFGASLLGRLPGGMVGFAIVLLVRDTSGSYATAGLVAASFTVALGLGAPVQGRLVDRFGQSRVLLAGAVASGGGLLTLGLVAHRLGSGGMAALAGFAGATMPPLPACMRALWPALLGGDQQVQAAYALESTMQELVFITGPLVVVGLVALGSPALAVAGAGALCLLGTVWFATAPRSRAVRGGARHLGWAGPLRSAGLRWLLLAAVLLACSFGVVEVTIPAFAEHAGNRAAAGPILSLWSLGSMLGGLAVGGRSWRGGAPRGLATLLGLVAVAFALLAVARSGPQLGAVIPLAGAPIAPALACAYLLVGRLAPDGTVTEAFTWVSSCFMGGIAAGNAAGGAIAQHAGVHLGFLVAAGLAAAAALTSAWQRGRLERHLDADPAARSPAGLDRAAPAGVAAEPASARPTR